MRTQNVAPFRVGVSQSDQADDRRFFGVRFCVAFAGGGEVLSPTKEQASLNQPAGLHTVGL